ncbi:MAG: hypothetical protein H0X01_01085, partial [Nitrospira sp.]|nr:hypothetical protein [Nitrospira sp.]
EVIEACARVAEDTDVAGIAEVSSREKRLIFAALDQIATAIRQVGRDEL